MSPPPLFRAAESALATSERGNISSHSLQHREKSVCQETTSVQHAKIQSMQPLTTQAWLASLVAGIKPTQGSEKCAGWEVPHRKSPGMRVTVFPPQPAFHVPPATDSNQPRPFLKRLFSLRTANFTLNVVLVYIINIC